MARVVRGAGEHLSPKLDVPKLMWLNETYGAAWIERVPRARARRLPHIQVHQRAREVDELSFMQVFLPATSAGPGWDVGFYRAIGLETLLENDAARIGARAQYPGNALGTGVTAAAARELGLAPGTPVATSSLIDADAGWLGSIRCHEGDQKQRPAEDRASARRAMGARVALCGHQHLPDVGGALALPRAGSVGPACMFICIQCMYNVHVYNIFMFSIQCLLQMDNVIHCCATDG